MCEKLSSVCLNIPKLVIISDSFNINYTISQLAIAFIFGSKNCTKLITGKENITRTLTLPIDSYVASSELRYFQFGYSCVNIVVLVIYNKVHIYSYTMTFILVTEAIATTIQLYVYTCYSYIHTYNLSYIILCILWIVNIQLATAYITGLHYWTDEKI